MVTAEKRIGAEMRMLWTDRWTDRWKMGWARSKGAVRLHQADCLMCLFHKVEQQQR